MPLTRLPAEAPSAEFTSDDVFVLKLSSDGSRVPCARAVRRGKYRLWLRHRGGADGSAVVSGRGPAIPVTEGALDFVPGSRAFLAKIAPAGDRLVFSTFLPGGEEAECLSIHSGDIDVLVRQNFPEFSSAPPDTGFSVSAGMEPGSSTRALRAPGWLFADSQRASSRWLPPHSRLPTLAIHRSRVRISLPSALVALRTPGRRWMRTFPEPRRWT